MASSARWKLPPVAEAIAWSVGDVDAVGVGGGVGVADGDGVDDDAVLRGDVGGLGGRHAAAGVGAVGEQDQDAGLDGARLEGADGEADGVAEHGVLAGHARLQRVEQAARGGGVAGEGDEDVGGAAEDDRGRCGRRGGRR